MTILHISPLATILKMGGTRCGRTWLAWSIFQSDKLQLKFLGALLKIDGTLTWEAFGEMYRIIHMFVLLGLSWIFDYRFVCPHMVFAAYLQLLAAKQ